MIRKLLLLLFMFSMCEQLFSQATDLVVDNQTPGWLSSKINYGDQVTVRNLKVTGYINETDLKFIGTLIQNRNLDGKLDLSDVNVVTENTSGMDNYMGESTFGITKDDTLSHVILPTTLKKMGAIFANRPNNYSSKLYYLYTDTLTFNCDINYIRQSFFGTCPKHLIVGEKVDSIPGSNISSGGTFSGSDLESIRLPRTIRYIGDYAFYNCNNLRFVNIEDLENVEIIGIRAFHKTMYQPDTLIIPKTIKEPYNLTAFNYKDGQHVFIPDHITTLNGLRSGTTQNPNYYSTSARCFFHINQKKCPKVTDVECRRLYPTWCQNITVYIPNGSTNTWKSSSNWSSWYNEIREQNVTLIEVNPVESLSLNEHHLSMDIGNTFQLSVSISPSDADDMTVKWEVEDSSIVSVDEKGDVTALKSGKTKIYVTSVPTGIQDVCEVTVIQHVTGIVMDVPELIFEKIGETMQLKVTIQPEDATDKSVRWSSSNPAVCSVTESGNIITLGYGTATIIATTIDGGYPATCVVKIVESSGIDNIVTSDTEVSDVYSTSGVKLRSSTSSLDELPKGIYVINGKKYVRQ